MKAIILVPPYVTTKSNLWGHYISDIAAGVFISSFLLIPAIANLFRFLLFGSRRTKLANAFTQRFSRIRKLARAEDDKPDNENEQQFRNAESKHKNSPFRLLCNLQGKFLK